MSWATGLYAVNRAATGAFAAKEVELLRTFADQAVDRDRERAAVQRDQEALERQTAPAEVLR